MPKRDFHCQELLPNDPGPYPVLFVLLDGLGPQMQRHSVVPAIRPSVDARCKGALIEILGENSCIQNRKFPGSMIFPTSPAILKPFSSFFPYFSLFPTFFINSPPVSIQFKPSSIGLENFFGLKRPVGEGAAPKLKPSDGT